MKLKLNAILILSATFAVSAHAVSEGRMKVIYGEDNRKDLYETTNSLELQNAESTVALISKSDLMAQADGFRLPARTFGADFNLCSTERFFDQPNPANCSGALVGKDLVLTAGHCITDAADCADYKFVFGFNVKQAGVYPSVIPAQDVVGCKEIVAHKLDGGRGSDFAVIRLDREITHRAPLAINRGPVVAVGERLTVIGHPSGIPTKIADGGIVRKNTDPSFFVASLDTYGGNSGSSVFNSTTGKIEGILVRGENDFVSRNGCTMSNVCTQDGCRGEDVTKISEAAAFIPEL